MLSIWTSPKSCRLVKILYHAPPEKVDRQLGSKTNRAHEYELE